ncbi:MAG: sugar ABC transporter permease [Microbacterium sp.]
MTQTLVAPAPPTAPATPSVPRRPRRHLGTVWTLVLFAAPFVVLFVVFRLVPTLWGMVLSLFKYRITGAMTWIGFDNFQRLFADAVFWESLRVTFVYVAIAVPATVAVSVVMAMMANRSMRGIRTYRALYFLPVLTSFVTTGLVWRWIYSAEGPLNAVITMFGADPVGFLSSDSLVLPSLSAVSVWTRFGYDMLIILAGLLAVPAEYYEAARMDGANAWHVFWHITLPQIRPQLFFVVILEIIQSFQVFDLIYVMTGGGPVRSSYTLTYFIYDAAFRSFDFGYASAIGVILLAITLVVSLVQRSFFKDVD